MLRYTIGAGGALTGDGTLVVLIGNNPWLVVIDPIGKFAYWSNIFDDQVVQFNIGTDGVLTPMSQPTVDITPSPGAEPALIAIDSTGRYAYVVSIGNGSVYQFQIGAGGALSPLGTASVSAGTAPISIALTR